jgi:hypothetical protein
MRYRSQIQWIHWNIAVTPEKLHNSSSSSTGTSFEKNSYMLGSFQRNQKKRDAVALHEAEVSRAAVGAATKA